MAITISGTDGITPLKVTNGTAAAPALTGDDTDSGIFFGTNEVNISTNGSTAAKVDSSGQLLVGTSTARSNTFNQSLSQAFQIEGTTSSARGAAIFSSSSNSGEGGYLILGHQRSGSIGGNTAVIDDSELGFIGFQGNDGAEFVDAARISAFVDSTPGSDDMPTRLVFSTTADGASTPTGRMVINRLGNTNIGSVLENADTRLYVQGAGTGSASSTIVGRNSAGTILHILRDDGAFNTGIAAVSPYNLTTVSGANMFQNSDGFVYRSTSSRKFKTNIETLEDSYADAILNIEPVWYRSTAPGDTKHSDWSHYGFIAEDVAAVDPRLVFWKTHEAESTEDGTINEVELDEPIAEGVQYDRFVPHLLNLIKRQHQAIETLETKVAALEAAE
mgnify:CR=1 FL=1